MDVHENARLTPHCRELLVDRAFKGCTKRHVARQFGISERTVQKWLRRYRAEGVCGLPVDPAVCGAAPERRCGNLSSRCWLCAASG